MIEIFYTSRFKKDIKKLFKKNRLIKEDIGELIKTLNLNPTTGTLLGNHCYKVRLKDSSSSKGKRGGYRVITYFVERDKRITLLTIYSKSEKSNITDEEIKALLKELP